MIKTSVALSALLCAAFAIAEPPPAPAKEPGKKAGKPKAEKPMAPGGKWHAGDMLRPRPRVITPPGMSTQDAAGAPPSDAKILFNGKDMANWKRDPRKEDKPGAPDTVQWKVADHYFEVVPFAGSIRTRDTFKGDVQLHIEWRAPSEVVGNSQGRGNSGIFLGGFPELQVLDSYQNDTYPDGQAGGLYGNYPPMVNASRKPGEWQTYDIIAERQRKDAKGNVIKKARLSVLLNGTVIQWGREFDAPDQEGDLGLQDHHNPVRYRNIWIRPINLTDPDSEGTPPPNAANPSGPAKPKAEAAAKPIAPAVIKIKTLTAQMKYDNTEFTVEPGQPVKLTFENGDDLPHNLVICERGTDTNAMAMKQMEKPDEAVKRNWLPVDSRILFHTRLLNPHEQETLSFTAPAKPGAYPFVCTFPGHSITMRGTLSVMPHGEGLKDLKFALYLGAWKNLPDFSKLKPHREGSVPDNMIDVKLDDYKNEFGVVFTGKLNAPQEGSYRFQLASDDGARMLIDGKELILNDGIHPSGTIKEASTKLTKGSHEFKLEYFQAAGNIDLYAAWKGSQFDMTPLSKWVPADLKGGKKKRDAETTGMPLAVTNETLIYRNFIAGAGTRSIGVGYPGGFNIAWSAETMNLALIWRGAFMDAARHWNSRGGGAQPPLGYDVVRPAGEVPLPFAPLAQPTDAWPTFDRTKDRAPDYAFQGYTLDQSTRAPTFKYTWKGLSITDRYVPEGVGTTSTGKLHRVLTVAGNVPPNTFLLIGEGKVEASGKAFKLDGGRFNLGGKDFTNQAIVIADNSQVAGSRLMLPVKTGEMHITYAWPN